MSAQTVKNYVGHRLQWLQKLPEHPQKAALASLRRGVGYAPGALPELWGVFLQDMPQEMQSKTGEPSREEWAIYLALTLYALHQQGHTLPQDSMNRAGERFGKAVRRLVKPGEDAADCSIQKRFNALATAANMQEISHHLRGMIQLLRAAGIPLDYPQLAADLYELCFSGTASHVRLRWGQDYYTTPAEEKATTNQTEKEKEK